MDFGKLFEYIAGSRGKIFFTTEKGEDFPKLYGSEPPQLDSLWKFLTNYGVDVKVFQRNYFNKEKQVGTEIIYDFAELIHTDTKQEGDIIAVAGGDRDLLKIDKEGQKKGYLVEYYCWERSTCGEIKSLENFHNLTTVIDKIGFIEESKFEHNFGEIDWKDAVPYYEKLNARYKLT